MKVVKKIIAVVATLAIIAVVFMAGFLTYKFTRPKAVSSYEWASKIIDDYYCGEYTDTGYAVLNLSGYTAGELALKGLASKLDPYSAYYTAAEYAAAQNDNAGQKKGIGISSSFVSGKGAVIVSVVGNSPAFKSGIRAGDVITGGRLGDETTNFSTSAEFTAFIDAIDDDTDFYLISDDGEYPNPVAKEEYRASYTLMYTNDTEWGFVSENIDERLTLYTKASTEMSFLPDGTAYVKLLQFYGTAASEFDILMENFKARGCTSLILDLRNNGGGYLNVMQDIAGNFTSTLSGKKIATTAHYKNSTETFMCTQKTRGLIGSDVHLYVLANSGTASASEALIGALVSYGFLDYKNIFLSEYSDEYLDWAKYTGEQREARTYGKGIMQTTYVNTFTHEALKLTTAKLYWQNGKCIHGVGLRAEDGCRVVQTDWVVTKGDTELKKAVAMISAQ